MRDVRHDGFATLVAACMVAVVLLVLAFVPPKPYPSQAEALAVSPVEKLTAREVGEDMSFAAFGSYESGDEWRNMDSFGWYGTSFPFKSGSPAESFYALLSGIPVPEDPALVLEEPTDYLDDCYVWYDEGTNVPYTGHCHFNIVQADSGGGKVVMHIYTEAGVLMATSDAWLFGVGQQWHEFRFTSATALTPGEKYIMAIGCDFDALTDIVQVRVTKTFGDYVAPPPPPPPPGPESRVLPLLKENSLTEGTLLR